MKLFDLHCDTISKVYKKKKSLGNGSCHISLDRAARYENYGQVMAIWSDHRLGDNDAYQQYHHIADQLLRSTDEERKRAAICRTGDELHAAWESGHAALFCAVEDARLLGGELDRLPVLYARGVRFMTLTWAGETCIGGSHDTSAGLTDFGRAAVGECFRLGIVPDLSHASDATIAEVLDMARTAGKPVIATHSNSRAIRDHARNLTDEQFRAIGETGGIVGISLCRTHLCDSDTPCNVDAVIAHIEHDLELGGEKMLCLGCDLDGTDLPDDIAGIEDLEKIADALAARGHSDTQIEDIFWRNAVHFIDKNLGA